MTIRTNDNDRTASPRQRRTVTAMRVLPAVVVAAVALTGCQLPDPPEFDHAPAVDTQLDTSDSGSDLPPEIATREPWEQDLYRQMTQPLPYSGGDPEGPCGSWGASTAQDAEEMAAIHRDCLANPAQYGMG